MLRRLYRIIIKEFIQAGRDPRLRIFLFLPPLVQLLSYGVGLIFVIRHVRTVVLDESRSL